MPDASAVSARCAALLALVACALPLARPASAQDIPRVPRADSAAYVPRPIAPADLDAVRPAAPDDPGGPPPRVALVTSQRPVVLLRDRGRAGTTAVVEATVQIGSDGQRSLVYSERAPAPTDIGAELGCGPAASRAIARLATLGEDALAIPDEGALVGAAQQLLCVVGYAVEQDGAFSEPMAETVFAFQQDTNAAAVEAGGAPSLYETGMLDAPTRRALESRARLRLGE